MQGSAIIKTFKLFLFAIVIAAIYLLTWPVPVDPQLWHAPQAPEPTGVFSVNTKLADFTALDLDGLHGSEAVISNAAGDLYASTHEGWIIRWMNGSQSAERWINVGGRPLGLAFDGAQNLWVANAYFGLQKVTLAGEVSVQTNNAEGISIGFADDVVITPNGKVYFSDASTKFSAQVDGGTLAASLLDIMEHGLHGRIIEFDPVTRTTRVIMRDLSFANGVTSAKNGEFLLVVETGSYRIWKHWLIGSKAGQNEVVVDNLPGFPDNIHRGKAGRYWIGLTTIRSAILDGLAAKPFQRKMVQRLPAFMRPKVQAYGYILAIDKQGEVLTSLQDPQGAYPATTGAWETDQYLYVSSLTASILARYEKTALGF